MTELNGRLVDYITGMEWSVCNEYHMAEWSNCESEDHAEGRRLLTELSDEPHNTESA